MNVLLLEKLTATASPEERVSGAMALIENNQEVRGCLSMEDLDKLNDVMNEWLEEMLKEIDETEALYASACQMERV